ncbi:MAG: hypothetical protein MdMp014T_1778 [Treponematales bacterium]
MRSRTNTDALTASRPARGVPAFLRGLVTVTALAALLAGCPMEGESGGGTKDNTAAVVSLRNLTGAVTAPVTDAVPDTAAIDTAQYTGTVAWQNAGGAAFTGNTFAASTVYKAVVTLTAKSGYTFAGVRPPLFHLHRRNESYQHVGQRDSNHHLPGNGGVSRAHGHGNNHRRGGRGADAHSGHRKPCL